MTFQSEKLNKVKNYIKEANQIVIVAHKSPDGDSVGSSVGLYHYLLKLKKNVTICHPDPAPYFLKWMKGTETILNALEHTDLLKEKVAQADLIFCLDFNNLSRTGEMESFLQKSNAKKVMIDHHLNPSNEFDVVFSETSSCSTAQLIIDFIEAMGDTQLLDKTIGEALYCGIMTDSGSFRFPSVSAHTHEVVATLLKAGLQPYIVHEAVYDTNTFDKLQLHSFAISERTEVVEEFNTIIIHLTKEDLERFNYVKGDAEGLVNVGLSVQGIRKSIFLMEHDGIIKISFRSKGEDNPVNEMASNYFQGGGHANASGGRWIGKMEDAINKVKNVLPEFS
ncbi:MAG: bifunctional oligoribonuclease/PAP phosphatase NrnA [Brumimicrobium sp.]